MHVIHVMSCRIRSNRVLACVLLLTISACACVGETVLVTVQSQTQEDMDALTAQVDAQAQGEGPARVTLGAIEATMSRVVDVDSPYLVTVPQSVPTLTLLGNVEFDPENQLWTLTYETMRADASGQINDYKRVLYMTRKNNLVQGDTRNPCLIPAADDAACLTELAVSYAVLNDVIPTPLADSLTSDGTMKEGCSDVCRVVSSVDDQPLSAMQTLTLKIPHSVVRDILATRTVHVHPLYGERTQYSFGVGMLFMTAGNNMVVFDAFDVIENSHDQVAISKLNSYAVARHVSFWTEVASHDPRLRIATVEYLLDKGQQLVKISAALNGHAINDTDCAHMQARIDELSDPTCITRQPLCSPAIYTTGAGPTLQTWASYVLPLPTWHTDTTYKINTLLTTNDTVTNTKILSTLNFETRSPPQPACENAKPVAFNPMQYVVAELFRGHELRVEQIGGSFSVQNETAFSMAESLMTIVLRPRDSDAAFEYFEKYADEQLALDQLYMTHAIHSSVLPDSIHNEAIGVENGRSAISLDSALLQTCPYESQMLYTDPAMECVTTHDWSLNGAIERPFSSPETASCVDCHYFVREVGVDVAGDLKWLQSNIFGSSDPGTVEVFYTQVIGLVPASPRNIAKHAKTYWAWPLYHWPGRAPIGLKDKTIVSLSWSIVKQELRRRRLLSLDAVEHPFGHQSAQSGAVRASRTERRRMNKQQRVRVIRRGLVKTQIRVAQQIQSRPTKAPHNQTQTRQVLPNKARTLSRNGYKLISKPFDAVNKLLHYHNDTQSKNQHQVYLSIRDSPIRTNLHAATPYIQTWNR